MHTRAERKMLVFRAARMWRSGPLCEPDSDANLRAEFRHIPEQQNTGGCPHCVIRCTRVRKEDVALQATRMPHSGSLCEP